MNQALTFANSLICNRFSQLHSFRTIAASLACFRFGRTWATTTEKQVAKEATGLVLAFGALAKIGLVSSRLLDASHEEWKTALFLGEPPKIHSRHEKLLERGRWTKTANRTDLLYLETNYIVMSGTATYPVDSGFRKIANFDYKKIHHPLSMCKAIESFAGASTNKVANLLLSAHATNRYIEFSEFSRFAVFDPLPADCFSGLEPGAKIFLHSCNAGETLKTSPTIAAWLSWQSGRDVVASSCAVSVQLPLNITFDPSTRDLTIRFPGNHNGVTDCTVQYHVTRSCSDRVIFFSKWAVAGAINAFTMWQTLRLAASILQASGHVIQSGVEYSAPPIRQAARQVGLYHPTLARSFYSVSIGAGRLLQAAGTIVHKSMDLALQPFSRVACALVKKTATLGQTLFNKYLPTLS